MKDAKPVSPAERLFKFANVSRRVSSSLDSQRVAREIVEGVRELTGGRFGVVAAFDSDRGCKTLFSSGLTEDEHRRLEEWPDGPPLSDPFGDQPGPLRVSDVTQHLRDRGIRTDLLPPGSLQCTPIRHLGVHFGNLYLVDRGSDQVASDEDDQILELFASQAAAAIANAHAHGHERRTREDLEAIVEASPVGVVAFDARFDNRVSANGEAKRIVEPLLDPGQTLHDVLGAMTLRLGNGTETTLREFLLAGCDSSASMLHAEEILFRASDGRSVAALVTTTRIHGTDGVVSIVLAMQDLAPLRERERHRAEFVSMVSHELRAPLSAIKGSIVALRDDAAAPSHAEMREYHRIIDEKTDHMRRLIGDLLDAGRVEARTLSVEPQPNEVTALVDKARNTFVSAGGRHSVLIDVATDLPRAMAECDRIVQVLVNLLWNAAKASSESSPIRVAATREGMHVAITVSDEGQGVAPEQLPQLFEKCSGVDLGTPSRGVGRGLGLAICKGLVEAHGGRIRAESGGIGRGARFTFTLPVVPDDDHPDVAIDRSELPVQEHRKHVCVLVLDDDPHMLRYVRDALAPAGYSVVATGDHRELPQLVRDHSPDLLLLDLLLPDTNGLDIMANVPELADMPIIFISAYGRAETIAKALDTGAADYIVKPFSPVELTARICRALRGPERKDPFRVGELVLDYDKHVVTLAGHSVELTASEFELLCVFSTNAGRVLSHDYLNRRIWNGRSGGDPRPARTLVKNLRRKLGDDANNPRYIVSVRGVGYRFRETHGP